MRDAYVTETTIGRLLKRRSERGENGDPLLSVTQDKGVIQQEEAGRRNISSANKAAYWRVYPDDIVYNTMRMWQGASARSAYFGIVSPAYTVCVPNDGISSAYLASVLKLPENITLFGTRSQGITSDVWNCRFKELARIQIRIVKDEECRRRVAEILAVIDEAVEHTEALIAKTEQIKAGLMHDLFTRGVTPKGELRPPRSEAPRLYKESPLGWIPKEWDTSTARKLCSVITKGTTPATSSFATEERKVRYLRVDNLTFDGSLNLSLEPLYIDLRTHRDALRRSIIRPGDVLMNIVGPPLGKVSLVPQSDFEGIRIRRLEYFECAR